MRKNILKVKNRFEFRQWLTAHSFKETECWIIVKRGKPIDHTIFYYLDAVEEALCFGWIDSTYAIINGVKMQRFSPRRRNSNWTELNKERVNRLEKLGLMTDAGRAVFPEISTQRFKVDSDIETALKQAQVWSKFKSFPLLYQRVRAGNIAFYKKHNPAIYEQMLSHLIAKTKKGQMYGEWNDYGRLLNY